MAQSCEFKVGQEKYNDQYCFLALIHDIYGKIDVRFEKRVIIINIKKKIFYPLDKVLSYLDDLKEMGFEYDHYKLNKSSIKIYIGLNNNLKHRGMIAAFCMCVRYIWEGHYNKDDNYTTNETLYKIFEYYNRLKKIFPLENKLLLMCYAHNFYHYYYKDNYNSNHTWIDNGYCKLKKTLDFKIYETNVNNYFTTSTELEISNEYPNAFDKLTDNNIIKILNSQK